MRGSDQATLARCVGVLLPLTLQQSVQAEYGRGQQTGLLVEAVNLNMNIMNYLADFRNTGVRRVGSPLGEK
jgi:hypothetical protein